MLDQYASKEKATNKIKQKMKIICIFGKKKSNAANKNMKKNTHSSFKVAFTITTISLELIT